VILRGLRGLGVRSDSFTGGLSPGGQDEGCHQDHGEDDVRALVNRVARHSFGLSLASGVIDREDGFPHASGKRPPQARASAVNLPCVLIKQAVLKFIRVYSCQIAVYFDVKVPINSTQLMKDEILLADEERKCERITICVEPEIQGAL
jgi:hypothetical protein